MVAYKRRRKVNPNDKDVKYTIKDSNGDTWVEYSVLHKGFIDWLKANNIDVDKVKGMSIEEINKIVEKSPYYKSTAMDIDWVSKVKMQGAIQKWVDHSISVTVNVPNNISVEMVGEIYRTAWESGCKGITIYREGSREGVLVSEKSKSKSNNGLKGEFFSDTDAPKRPKVLEADVKRFQNDKEKWIAVVGLLNGRPYEIFTGRAEGISIPLKVEKGWVIKVKSEGVTRYDFQYVDGRDEDGREYRATIEGLSRSFNKEYWNYARLISGILRHGMPLVHVVNVINNLKLDSESITTWKNGVERVLKTYIPTGTKVKGEKCSNCGSDALVYKEGCVTCESCGHTLCG